MPKCEECGHHTPPYATVLDVMECKGRLGSRGSWRDRFGAWLAGVVTSAIMRSPQFRKEMAIAIHRDVELVSEQLRNPPPIPPAKNY